MLDNRKINMLDAMTILGFLIGVANYDENITQSDLQEMMKSALNDIHSHLQEQDRKINDILKMLKEER